jgi:hypothetical protein
MDRADAIRVAIVSDDYLLEPKDSHDLVTRDFVRQLQYLCELGENLTCVWAGFTPSHLPDSGVDLLIIDYGGMSSFGARDTATFNIRLCCEWAQNHPGTLCVLFTTFTMGLYEDELEGEFGHIDNILALYATRNSYERTNAANIRRWLGMKEHDEPGA